MTLVLEIEFLSGTSFAAIGPSSQASDWPPEVDRIYSALTATWAAHGQDDAETSALRWLENLDPPKLVASDAWQRDSLVVFVPPNDPRSDRQKVARGVLPALRSRQPRRFPAARPHDPIVRIVWPEATPDEKQLQVLHGLARDTSYVGHSASLTRCRFFLDNNPNLDRARSAGRRVYPGRLDELRRAYASGERPQPGAHVSPPPPVKPTRTNVFAEKWLILEHVDGDMPDIRAAPVVARTIRNTILSGYNRLGIGDKIPEAISGHAPDGSPSQRPHMAIVPLAFAGFPYADGHVMGFALVPPHGGEILRDDVFLGVLRHMASSNTEGQRILTVTAAKGTPSNSAFSLSLAPVMEAAKRSLDPLLYTRDARIFATVTPIVLDRHLKQEGEARQDEICVQIAAACHNVGLPKPERILPDKHPALEGVPSAYPSGKAPAWMRWRVPESLANRQLTHAVIHFAEQVPGPVLLGAGRYLGLGLCRPLQEGSE